MTLNRTFKNYWKSALLPIAGAGVIAMSLTGAYTTVRAQQQPGFNYAQAEELAIKASFAEQKRKIDAFAKHLESDANVNAEAREKARQVVLKRSLDPDRRKDSIIDGLTKVYPLFDEGLDLFDEDEIEDAIKTFKKMAEANDKWLAVNSKLMQARAYVANENFEQAIPLLEALCDEKQGMMDYCLHDDEAMFMLAIAQQKTLQYEAAVKTLETFIEKYGFTAPERMVVGAATTLVTLKQMEKGSLEDVHAHMQWSKRRLDLEDTGDNTQGKHQKIVKMLDVLIEKAEQNENSSSSSSSSSGGQGGQQQKPGQGDGPGGENPSSPMEESKLADGDASVKDLARKITGKDGEQWGAQRQKDREKVLNSIKDKMPDRYRKLTEEYYKSLRGEYKRSDTDDD